MRTLYGYMVLLGVVVAAAASCSADVPATVMTADVTGSVDASHRGTAIFFSSSGPLLASYSSSVHSLSERDGVRQELSFLGVQRFEHGTMPLGDEPLLERPFASYHYQEDGIRRIFTARSGTLEVTESSAVAVAGSFQYTADLVMRCTVAPGFPGQIMECEAAAGETVQIAGSFRAARRSPGGLIAVD
jgi:hypothetical protein